MKPLPPSWPKDSTSWGLSLCRGCSSSLWNDNKGTKQLELSRVSWSGVVVREKKAKWGWKRREKECGFSSCRYRGRLAVSTAQSNSQCRSQSHELRTPKGTSRKPSTHPHSQNQQYCDPYSLHLLHLRCQVRAGHPAFDVICDGAGRQAAVLPGGAGSPGEEQIS